MSESAQEALLLQKSNLVFSRAEPKHKQVRGGLVCAVCVVYGLSTRRTSIVC